MVDIDRAMRWGFGWDRGPFETWDALGVKATAEKMQAAGIKVPEWVLARLAAGRGALLQEGRPHPAVAAAALGRLRRHPGGSAG